MPEHPLLDDGVAGLVGSVSTVDEPVEVAVDPGLAAIAGHPCRVVEGARGAELQIGLVLVVVRLSRIGTVPAYVPNGCDPAPVVGSGIGVVGAVLMARKPKGELAPMPEIPVRNTSGAASSPDETEEMEDA